MVTEGAGSKLPSGTEWPLSSGLRNGVVAQECACTSVILRAVDGTSQRDGNRNCSIIVERFDVRCHHRLPRTQSKMKEGNRRYTLLIAP